MAVAESAFCGGSSAHVAGVVNRLDFDACLRNVLSVGACVHINRATEAPGDACEFVDSG